MERVKKMSNSKLVNYTKISSNKNKGRVHNIYNPKGTIDKITIHHMAGNLSVETCGNIFSGTRQTSSNYGIGSDGRVGLYVDEKDRAWTSGSRENDYHAITIEVANDQIGGDWHISDKALSKLIELCVDICKRNGIKKLNYTGDKTGNLTMHCWFQATACPGPYLKSKFQYIADSVNKLLVEPPKADQKPLENTGIKIGDIVQFKGGNHYPSADSIQGYLVKSSKARVTAISKSSKHKYHIRAVNSAGEYTYGVYGWVDEANISLLSTSNASVTPTLKTLRVGDIVDFIGDTHYASTSSTKGFSVKPSKAKITSLHSTGKHPIHLRAVNSNGAYTAGVYGWVDLSDIRV